MWANITPADQPARGRDANGQDQQPCQAEGTEEEEDNERAQTYKDSPVGATIVPKKGKVEKEKKDNVERVADVSRQRRMRDKAKLRAADRSHTYWPPRGPIFVAPSRLIAPPVHGLSTRCRRNDVLYRGGDIEKNPGPKRALHPRGRDVLVQGVLVQDVLPTVAQRYDVAESEFEEYLRVRETFMGSTAGVIIAAGPSPSGPGSEPQYLMKSR